MFAMIARCGSSIPLCRTQSAKRVKARRCIRRPKAALLEWRTLSRYTLATDFVFPSVRKKGQKPLDLGAVLNRKIKPAFANIGITGVGWHTFRHTVGAMLADMGEHQLTTRDYAFALLRVPTCSGAEVRPQAETNSFRPADFSRQMARVRWLECLALSSSVDALPPQDPAKSLQTPGSRARNTSPLRGLSRRHQESLGRFPFSMPLT
jgi:hypothetical protein